MLCLIIVNFSSNITWVKPNLTFGIVTITPAPPASLKDAVCSSLLYLLKCVVLYILYILCLNQCFSTGVPQDILTQLQIIFVCFYHLNFLGRSFLVQNLPNREFPDCIGSVNFFWRQMAPTKFFLLLKGFLKLCFVAKGVPQILFCSLRGSAKFCFGQKGSAKPKRLRNTVLNS